MEKSFTRKVTTKARAMLGSGLWYQYQWIRMESWKIGGLPLRKTSGVTEEGSKSLSFRNDGIYFIFIVTTLLLGFATAEFVVEIMLSTLSYSITVLIIY